MIFLIAAILVALPALTSVYGELFTLTAFNPQAIFTTPNYSKTYDFQEDFVWTVDAPGNVDRLNLTCYLDIHESEDCVDTSFIIYSFDGMTRSCGEKFISQTLNGSTIMLNLNSRLTNNNIHKGVSCMVSYNPNDIPTCTTPSNPFCSCGQKRSERIVDGEETTPNEYPWHAMLFNKSSDLPFCRGSVIATQWVLSSTRCVRNKSASSISVILGEHNYETCDLFSHEFEITEIIRHENYDQKTKWNNDIALLRLAEPATFNKFISPICLPFNYKYYDFTDQTGVTKGWGKTIPGNDDSDSGVQKDINQNIIMPFKCTWLDANGWRSGQITENMICAEEENESPYSGDIGHPMVWQSESSELYFQVGVFSFFNQANERHQPHVYTRVSQFLSWILDKTGAKEKFCVKV